MWLVPGTILGEAYFSSLCFYLDAKPSHMGVDMDALAYHRHRPT
jgi:hypothetical protein